MGSPFALLLAAIPEGMTWEYHVRIRGGRLEHLWALANEAGGIHVSAWRYTETTGCVTWSGGIECHSPKRLYETAREKPDHECCWLLGGPCWHDGSSLQFSEQIAPMLPNPTKETADEMGEEEHGFILRLMIHRHRVWLTEREDA